MPSKEIRAYWAKVAELGCLMNGSKAEIHHCKSGSMSNYGIHTTGSKKNSNWLVIPLSPRFHRGKDGIHTIGVQTWEEKYQAQIVHLKVISLILKVDVFEKAGYRFDVESDRYEKI